jgi:hypothetical protein
MFVTKVEPQLEVALAEGTVATVQGLAAVPKEVVIDNLDAANTLTWKFQYSDDASTWTDIGVSATLAAGGSVRTTLEDHVFYRLRASGDLNISMMVEARVPFADMFSFLIA